MTSKKPKASHNLMQKVSCATNLGGEVGWLGLEYKIVGAILRTDGQNNIAGKINP